MSALTHMNSIHKGEIVWNGLSIEYTQQPFDGGPYAGEIEITTRNPEIEDDKVFEAHLIEQGYDEDQYPITASVTFILIGLRTLQGLPDNEIGHVVEYPGLDALIQLAANELMADPDDYLKLACAEDAA